MNLCNFLTLYCLFGYYYWKCDILHSLHEIGFVWVPFMLLTDKVAMHWLNASVYIRDSVSWRIPGRAWVPSAKLVSCGDRSSLGCVVGLLLRLLKFSIWFFYRRYDIFVLISVVFSSESTWIYFSTVSITCGFFYHHFQSLREWSLILLDAFHSWLELQLSRMKRRIYAVFRQICIMT